MIQTKAMIDEHLKETETIASKTSRDSLVKIVDLLFSAWKNERWVFICGNGGSASTATHFACDLAKSTIVPGKKRFKVLSLNENVPLLTAITNDNGWDNLYTEQLLSLFGKGDVLVCLSVHGGTGKDKAGLWSQNLVKAMVLAKQMGGKTIGFSGFDGGVFKEIADACVVVPADSTPHVESFHALYEHLICKCLKARVEEEP